MLQLTAQDLTADHLTLAWPLVRTLSPETNVERWLAAARKLIDRGGGWVGVATEAGSLRGLASYEPVGSPAGKILQVDAMVTFEVSRRAPVRRALCEALDRLATRLGCEAVAVKIANRGFLPEMPKKSGALI